MGHLRDQFSEHFLPNDEEKRKVIRGAIITPDANVLLNLYRYSPETRAALVKSLSASGGRLWLTHQAALEFHRNRELVIGDQVARCRAARKRVRSMKHDIEALHKEERSAPFLEPEILEQVTNGLRAAEGDIQRQLDDFEEYFQSDPIRDELDATFGQQVWEPYAPEDLQAIYKAGKLRYGEKQPPGFEDSSKGHPGMYGDLVLWHQMMDIAKQKGCAIVLITDDMKPDWWLAVKDRVLGPRPELVHEMERASSQGYLSVTPLEFLELSQEGTEVVGEDVLREVESISSGLSAEDREAIRVASSSLGQSDLEIAEYLAELEVNARHGLGPTSSGSNQVAPAGVFRQWPWVQGRLFSSPPASGARFEGQYPETGMQGLLNLGLLRERDEVAREMVASWRKAEQDRNRTDTLDKSVEDQPARKDTEDPG